MAKDKTKLKLIKSIITGILTGTANGLFGSGGGTIVVPSLVLLMGLEEHKAHATAIFIILPLTLVSAFLYTSKGYTDWYTTLLIISGGIAGGYIGARLLYLCSESSLRKIFAVFMIIAALRMLFS